MDMEEITLFSVVHLSSNVKVGNALKKSSGFTYQAVWQQSSLALRLKENLQL